MLEVPLIHLTRFAGQAAWHMLYHLWRWASGAVTVEAVTGRQLFGNISITNGELLAHFNIRKRSNLQMFLLNHPVSAIGPRMAGVVEA